MATALPTRQKPALDGHAARDPQVYHPLDQLRGTIRRYVVIEGVLSAVLFLTLWFTVGLALDYGVFKALWWDWALDGSWWVRCLALVLAVSLFGSILVVRIGRRVNKEFSYPALALVLERKFPKVLGDRLITAVEMADVEAMGRFGYSTEMIRATIAEARERVAKVPVHEVFNWGRLRRMAALTAALAVGFLGCAYASYGYMARSADPYRFAWKCAHVTGIFVERNVALMNTPWPRDAYLELVGMPEGTEIAIGRNAEPPQITARAYRWVIADRGSVHGWRPMLWSDVTPQLVGRAVPDLPFAALRLPGEAGDMPPDASAWTLDTVEARASELETRRAKETDAVRRELRSRMGGEFDQLQEVFRALAEKADEPGMARTVRRLGTTRNQFKITERDPRTRELQFVFRFDRDAEIVAEYQFSGKKTRESGTLRREGDVFEGTISGLKEDVEFIVRAADFDTTPRKVRIIPPPSLKRLSREQSEPGYLHHAPPLNEGYNALENQLQKIVAKDLSLTGEQTVVVVPAGTALTLTADAYTADDGTVPDTDRIVSATAVPETGRFPGTVYDETGKATRAPVPLALAGDGAGFRITFAETVPLPRRLNTGPDFAGTALAAAVGAVRKHTDFRLTENVKFEVEFVNKYNVSTKRSFSIQVVQDQAPVVEVAVDVIRKVGNFYLVTPKARIPFETNSFVKDDRGLNKVEYTFSYYAEDSDFVRGLRAKLALRSLLDVPLPGTAPAALLPRLHAENFRLLDKTDDRLSSSVFVGEFSIQQGNLLRDNRDDLGALLGTSKGEELIPTFARLLDDRYPARRPAEKVFWVGSQQAVKAFWVGEPYTAKTVWAADTSDPQAFTKLEMKSAERGAFRRELIERKAIGEADAIHWYSEPQTVKRVELKNPNNDYFDLKELHDKGLLAIAAKSASDVQTIYRMDLNVQATDTNVDNEGGPRVTRNAEPIRLRIVSEGDLLIEISKEEEQLAARLDEALLKLAAAKKKYEFVRSSNGYKDETPEQVDAVKVRSQDALGDVEKARDVVQTVAREYRRLTRECEINRVNEAAQKRYTDFTAEIETVLSESPTAAVTFVKTQALLTGVQNTLNSGRWAPLAAVSDAENSLYALERRVKEIRDKLGEAQTLDKLKQAVVAIKEKQARIRQEIEVIEADYIGKLNLKHPTIGSSGVVSLTKGETKKVQHTIAWNQYKEDDIALKFAASDPSLTIAPTMTLNFEKHQFRFEYEIKAGNKDGTFKVTLTPAVGPPVEVQVIVK